MHLKRLEIQGFKTFATKTIFEFRPGVSAIVGPNGSGKSNVVDAMRWVLGEQSYSTLRSRKAEDLIFGGGPRRAPAGFAEVSLTIDNSDRTLPLAFDTVTITRRSTRSGEHEYFINKAKVRLRDIQEATATLGGSYTIINQGLVDNVLDLRPEERRRLFEDAADISVHEQRRNDAMRRLRETDTNVRRCDDVISELEPRLRSLRRQANAAKQYRDLRHELDAAQIRLLRLQHAQATAHIDLARHSDQTAHQHVASISQHLQQCNSHISTIRQQIRTLREEISTVYAEGSRLHSRAESLQRAIAVADERAKALVARTNEFTQSQNEATTQHQTLQTQIAELHTTRTGQQQTRDDIHASLRAIDATRASYNEQRRALRQAVDTAQRAEAATQAAIRTKRTPAGEHRRSRPRQPAHRLATGHRRRQPAPNLAHHGPNCHQHHPPANRDHPQRTGRPRRSPHRRPTRPQPARFALPSTTANPAQSWRRGTRGQGGLGMGRTEQ